MCLQGVDTLPDYGKLVLPTLPSLPLSSVLPGGPPGAVSLLQRFLIYDPAKRFSAAEVTLTLGALWFMSTNVADCD